METFPSCFWLFLSESASSGTALFRRPSWAALLSGLRGLRFVLPSFFRSLGAVALGHTGCLLRYSEQEVLFPEGSQVMVKDLLKACNFQRRIQLNSTQETSKRRASRPGPVVHPTKGTARPVASERSHGPHGALLPLHRTTTSLSLVWGWSHAVVGFRGSDRRWWSTSDNGKRQLSQDTSG